VNLLAVAGGGAIGASLRYLLGLWVVRGHVDAYPWATLAANVLGSAILGGVTIYATEAAALSAPARLFLTVGLCGGFTTFSTFAYETADFAARGLPGRALAYALLSVTLCVAAIAGGGALGQALARR
jgi:CrcB protein